MTMVGTYRVGLATQDEGTWLFVGSLWLGPLRSEEQAATALPGLWNFALSEGVSDADPLKGGHPGSDGEVELSVHTAEIYHVVVSANESISGLAVEDVPSALENVFRREMGID